MSPARLVRARAEVERRLRRQRLIERIHGLGARVVFELVDELDRAHDRGVSLDLDHRLARYAGLGPFTLRATGGDRFAPAPLRIVRPNG